MGAKSCTKGFEQSCTKYDKTVMASQSKNEFQKSEQEVQNSEACSWLIWLSRY